MQRSDSSKRSPAVAMLATHLHFWMFGSSTTLSRVGSPARAKGSEGQVQTETARGCFHVTSRHDHQRVPPSFTDSPTSSTLVQRFATLSRDNQRSGKTRAPLPEHCKQREERTQQRSATKIAVYLLCVLCARFDLLLDTKGLCDDSSVCYAENKCTAQA